MEVTMQEVELQLKKTSGTLLKYGFGFWSNKLEAIKDEIGAKNDREILDKIQSLYGGFGTLLDLAVDPFELPEGIGEENGNKELLGEINSLHKVVRVLKESMDH